MKEPPNILSSDEQLDKGLLLGLKVHVLVDTMHQRKTKMDELSDGVIALPGGFGTLEEFFEMLTWAQLGLHKKPIGILNIEGYYDELLIFYYHV